VTEETARALASLGHHVETAWPRTLCEAPSATHPGMAFVGFRYLMRDPARMLRRPVERDDVEPGLWNVAHLPVPPVPAEEYMAHAERVQEWVERLASWWTSGVDLLLTATVCEPAVPIERIVALSADPVALGKPGPASLCPDPALQPDRPARDLAAPPLDSGGPPGRCSAMEPQIPDPCRKTRKKRPLHAADCRNAEGRLHDSPEKSPGGGRGPLANA
jgi:hypothetical protein